jgi:hypothetical protein
LVWTYATAGSGNQVSYDSTRGATKYLSTGTSAQQTTDANSLTAFNASGFDLGTANVSNASLAAYRYFAWKKSSGFLDIVTYVGNATNRTINHSLGSAPAMMLVKRLDGANNGWVMFHQNMNASPGTVAYIWNNATFSISTNVVIWNNTAPTSSVFSLGTSANINASTSNFIAYLFGTSSGRSAFGTYTGNGSATGPTVSLGFTPSMVLICLQAASTSNIWMVYGNNTSTKLNIDDAAQDATNYVDLLSTGFQIKTTNADFNTNSSTYIYAAWA